MWIPWEGAGLEHLFLQEVGEGFFADGVVIGASEDELFRIRYRVRCDVRWRVRELMLQSLEDRGREVRLLADVEGSWWPSDGESLPLLQGCIDVDISTTPFTNTLPIRRLPWAPANPRKFALVMQEFPVWQFAWGGSGITSSKGTLAEAV